MKTGTKVLKNIGGCATMMGLPWICLALFMTLDGEGAFAGLFMASIFMVPGFFLWAHALRAHKNHVESITAMLKTHKTVKVPELADKIGLNEANTEILLGQISATDNGITLFFDQELQAYRVEKTNDDQRYGRQLDEWVIVLAKSRLSASQKKNIIALTNLNESAFEQLETTKSILPISTSGTKEKAESIAKDFARIGIACHVKKVLSPDESVLPFIWQIKNRFSRFTVDASLIHESWIKLNTPSPEEPRVGKARNALREARKTILRSEVSQMIIDDLLPAIDEMEKDLEREKSRPPSSESEANVQEIIDSAEELRMAAGGEDKKLNAATRARNKAKMLAKTRKQIR